MTLEELLELLGLDAEAGEKIIAFADAQAAGPKRANVQLKSEKRELQAKLDAFSGFDRDEIASALGLDSEDVDLDDLPSLIEGVKGTADWSFG